MGGVGTSPLAVSGHVDADADGERDADGEDGEENEVLATDLAVPLITQSAPDTSGPSESAAIAARANASTSSSLTGTGTGTGTDPIAAHAAALAATSSNSSGTDPISTHANALASAPAPSFANDTYSAASTSDEQTSSRPAAPHHSESDHVPGGFPGTHLTGTPYDAFPPGQGGEGEGRLGRT